MRSKLLALIAILPALLGTEPGPAQSPPPGVPYSGTPGPQRQSRREKFEAANTTHDGRLTLAQAQAGGMRLVSRNFEAIDTGHKGYVTMQDIRTFVRARRAARQAEPATP